MEKDKSTGHNGGLPPPSGRFSGLSPFGSGFKMSPDSSSSAFNPVAPCSGSDRTHFSHGLESSNFNHDISRMPDNPPKNLGHRRARSEIISLPDDTSFDGDVGVVGGADGPSLSDETEEDLFSMFLNMDKLNSTSAISNFQVGEPSAPAMAVPSAPQVSDEPTERLKVRHQYSQSMDGSSPIKPEMLMSCSEEVSPAGTKKAMSSAKLAELALIDPKRAKRVWANRQSAARSKERKIRYIAELEQKVQTLQTKATALSAEMTLLQRGSSTLTAENRELKLRLQTMDQQFQLQDALNDALKEEIKHLKVLTGQSMQNGGPMMNFTALGANQQVNPNNQATPTYLTAEQFQQLQIQSENLQQQHFQQHQQLEQQRRQAGDLRMRESTPDGKNDN